MKRKYSLSEGGLIFRHRQKLTGTERTRIALVTTVVLLVFMLAASWIIMKKLGAVEQLRLREQLEAANAELKAARRQIVLAAGDLEAGTVIENSSIIYSSVLKSYGTEWDTEMLGKLLLVDVAEGEEITPMMLGERQFFTSEREVRFANLSIPDSISEGDFIDIRIKEPDGSDKVVLTKKQVMKGDSHMGTLDLYVDEEELQRMNNAELYRASTGSLIYAVKYISPYFQSGAEITYKEH